MSDAPDLTPEAVERLARWLDRTPLYEGSGEEPDQIEQAVATLRAQAARIADLEAALATARAYHRLIVAKVTGNQSAMRCDACRAVGMIHCPEAWDGCNGMRDYTAEEVLALLDQSAPDPLTAALALPKVQALIEGQTLACDVIDPADRYGRPVVRCVMTDGRDLACALVAAGAAEDWARYSGGAYAGCGG